MTMTIYRGVSDNRWHIRDTHQNAKCGENIFNTETIKIGHDGSRFLKEPPQSEFCSRCFTK